MFELLRMTAINMLRRALETLEALERLEAAARGRAGSGEADGDSLGAGSSEGGGVEGVAPGDAPPAAPGALPPLAAPDTPPPAAPGVLPPLAIPETPPPAAPGDLPPLAAPDTPHPAAPVALPPFAMPETPPPAAPLTPGAQAAQARAQGFKAKYQYVNLARDYIRENCQDSMLSLGDVAEHVGISASYLSHIFYEATGQRFVDCLNASRVERAKGLLSGTALPITEVAANSGFYAVQSFNRVFKQYVGATPGQYRRAAAARPRGR